MDKNVKSFELKWKTNWSGNGPFDSRLMEEFPDRWVRFHTLPDSKRYPETAEEFQIILDRHNTVLTELDPGEKILVITTQWSNHSADPALDEHSINPGAKHWRTIFESQGETDPDFFTYRYYYIGERPWSPGAADDLLREVADDNLIGVIIAPSDMRWLYHPYDGGMDVYCTSRSQRDQLKELYKDWLSSHPQGL